MGRHGRSTSTESFLAGEYGSAQRLNGWADAGGPDSPRPPDDECPDCGDDGWTLLGAVRRCTGCGQLRSVT
jgi:hypothetical protein